MTRYKVDIDAVLEATSNADAARRMAVYFVVLAEQWDAEEVDWDTLSQASPFLAPTEASIRPI